MNGNNFLGIPWRGDWLFWLYWQLKLIFPRGWKGNCICCIKKGKSLWKGLILLDRDYIPVLSGNQGLIHFSVRQKRRKGINASTIETVHTRLRSTYTMLRWPRSRILDDNVQVFTAFIIIILLFYLYNRRKSGVRSVGVMSDVKKRVKLLKCIKLFSFQTMASKPCDASIRACISCGNWEQKKQT